MRALQIVEPMKCRVVEVPTPRPSRGEILVRMIASSICNQHELKCWRGEGYYWLRYPLPPGMPGHEGVGTVVERGEGVDKVDVGDVVALTGMGGPPLHAEYVVRREDAVVKVKCERVSPEYAAPLELYACVIAAIRKSGGVFGCRTVVSGLGPAGLVAVQVMRAAGAAHIVGIEPNPERRRKALECGADEVYHPESPEVERLKREGVEYVFEASGHPDSIRNSLKISRDKVVLFGYHEGEIPINTALWFQHDLTVYGSRALSGRGGGIENLRIAVDLYCRGAIDPSKLVTHRIRLEEYPKAMQLISSGEALKILIVY